MKTSVLLASAILAGSLTAGISDGPDVLIRGGTIVATASDYEMDGTMWTAFTNPNDSITYIYHSTDHGLGWIFRGGVRFESLVLDRIGFVKGEGDSAFGYLFYLTDDGNGDLWLLRWDFDQDTVLWFPVCVGADTVRQFSVCRDYSGDNYWLYAVVTNVDTLAGHSSIRFLRSSTFGREWYVTDSFRGRFNDPQLSAGAGSRIYFTYWNDAPPQHALSVWVNRLWMSPGYWVLNWWPLGTDELADPVVAADFTVPESLATIWVLWSQNYNNSGDWDIKYRYWLGDGSGWSTPSYLAGSTAARERFPDLRNYTSLGNPYVNASYISETGPDRVVFRHYAHGLNPGSWSAPLRINDGNAGTGPEVRPKLCYSPGGPFSGAGCVFVGDGLNGIWWNAPYPSGAAEPGRNSTVPARLVARPSVGPGPFRFSGASQMSIYDAAGRCVRRLKAAGSEPGPVWDGRDESGRRVRSGVYVVLDETGTGRVRVVITE